MKRAAGPKFSFAGLSESEKLAGKSGEQMLQDLANKFKEAGNKEFEACRYEKAVELYTKAIEAYRSPIFFANRAAAYLKTESFVNAFKDASASLSLDPNYIKAYHRRGSALLGMQKFQEAHEDFSKVCTIAPHDSESQRKLKECKKAIENIRLLDIQNSMDNARAEDIQVEASYTGPRLPADGKVTEEFVREMIVAFKAEKRLHCKYALQILKQVKSILDALPNIVHFDAPDGQHINVCGDTHGQFYDVCNIFDLYGHPSDSNPYVFNGDFVDRGAFGVEIVLTFFAYKCLYPNALHLTRGNHESKALNIAYGFFGEVKDKFKGTDKDGAERGTKVFTWIQECFDRLPLACVLNRKVMVLHGGLFSRDNVTIDDLQKLNRKSGDIPSDGLMSEILWSDPMQYDGRAPSRRGVALLFGPDVTRNFLQTNNLELIVRSHEVREEGYSQEHDGQLITLFSAPRYCDQLTNKGALIKFTGPGMKPVFSTFEAVPHPPRSILQYANLM